MEIQRTERFLKSYAGASLAIQLATDKQLKLLINDLRHPSLRAKKYRGTSEIWQARINRGGWRLYFKIDASCYVLLDMTKHPK